jgi:hypothetical protein
MKSVLEPSARSHEPSSTVFQSEPGGVQSANWVCPIWVRCRPVPNGPAVRADRGKADHLPHHGLSLETGELRSERWGAIPSKLPRPVMSRTKSRGPVVVRARESRVHGEGGQ